MPHCPSRLCMCWCRFDSREQELLRCSGCAAAAMPSNLPSIPIPPSPPPCSLPPAFAAVRQRQGPERGQLQGQPAGRALERPRLPLPQRPVQRVHAGRAACRPTHRVSRHGAAGVAFVPSSVIDATVRRHCRLFVCICAACCMHLPAQRIVFFTRCHHPTHGRVMSDDALERFVSGGTLALGAEWSICLAQLHEGCALVPMSCSANLCLHAEHAELAAGACMGRARQQAYHHIALLGCAMLHSILKQSRSNAAALTPGPLCSDSAAYRIHDLAICMLTRGMMVSARSVCTRVQHAWCTAVWTWRSVQVQCNLPGNVLLPAPSWHCCGPAAQMPTSPAHRVSHTLPLLCRWTSR